MRIRSTLTTGYKKERLIIHSASVDAYEKK